MKARIVRAVDSGNIQRSPTFQAIFSFFFSDPGVLPFPVVFDGAGMDVDKIMSNCTPAVRQLEIIDAGKHYGLVDGGNERLADELVSLWSGKNEAQIPDAEKRRITGLYSEVKTDVHILQMRFRNDALLDAGIPIRYLPGMRTPFRHDDCLVMILPVEDSIAGKIADFYAPLRVRQPMTRTYGSLAGAGPLADELTGGMETARRQVKYFMDTRDKAMEEMTRLLSAIG